MAKMISYFFLLAIPPLALLYAVIGLIVDPKNWRKYLFFLIYFFFVLVCALTLKEGSNKDLVRYYQWMEQASNLSLADAIDFKNDGLYTMNILYWAFGHLGYPQLLPAFAISIVLFTMCYITCDMAEQRHAWKHIKIIIAYQLMVLPFMYVMETIRSGMAFSLIILMAYLEFVKKKRSVWIWIVYIASVFIHSFSIVIIMLRLICSLPGKLGKAMFFVPPFAGAIIAFAYNNINMLSNYTLLYTAIRRMNYYFYQSNTAYATGTANNAFFFRMKIVMCAEAILMIIIAYYYMSRKSSEKPENKKMLLLFTMINLVAVSIINAPNPMYWRFTSAAYSCCAAYMLPVQCNYRVTSPLIKASYWALWVLAIPSLYLQLRWGLTYADSTINWFGNAVVTNIFTILYKVIINFL